MKKQPLRAPRITHISWGHMKAEGLGTGKDFKLYPGGGRAWDWNETNTHHVPGIQPADVEELLARGSKAVVLSRGMELALQTCPETLQKLNKGRSSCLAAGAWSLDIFNLTSSSYMRLSNASALFTYSLLGYSWINRANALRASSGRLLCA